MLGLNADEMTQSHLFNRGDPSMRGINVYTYSDLMGVTGKTQDGSYAYGRYEQPLFNLTVDERINIFRFCSYVLGIVTSRMNRMSALSWDVVPDSKNEDKIVDELRDAKAIFDEYEKADELVSKTVRFQMVRFIRETLKDALNDLSNFDASLVRWRRRIKSKKQDRASEIEDWMFEPNVEDTWEDFIKKYVFDLMIHGSTSVYKEHTELGGEYQLDNLYTLPGGSVIPIRNHYVGGSKAFVQIVLGFDPQIYFTDEIAYANYIPTSARSYGMVPLDALVNKIAESLFFDKLMAEQADGTKPPEKIVVFGDSSPFGDVKKEFNTPLQKNEQKRIETVINEARKNAIRVLSGTGQPMVLDMTRENTMSTQLERQKIIKSDIALVYNMSNVEINETDSGGTSGRSTSETQERIELNKAIIPTAMIVQSMYNRNVIPYKFGSGYKFEFENTKDRMTQLNEYQLMLQTGVWDVNHIRTQEEGMDPYPEEEYNRPQNAGQAGEQPDAGSSEMSPMFMSQV